MKYITRKDGEGWEIKNKSVFRIACCDCGLIHDMVVFAPRLPKGMTLGIAAKRNNRATVARRKRNG